MADGVCRQRVDTHPTYHGCLRKTRIWVSLENDREWQEPTVNSCLLDGVGGVLVFFDAMKVQTEIRDMLESLASNGETLRSLASQMKKGNGVTPFVGAGMSVPLDYKGWGDFLLEISEKFSVKSVVTSQIKAGQFEEAAQTCLDAGGSGAFQDAVSKAFGPSRIENKPINAAVRYVPEFTRGPLVTTNFDRVLEIVFERARKPFEERVWGSRATIAVQGFFGNRRYLLKLHGDVIDTKDRILTRVEYEKSYGVPGQRYVDVPPPLHDLIRLIMTNRPLLFLGCSLSADRITGFLKDTYLQYGQLLHYAIVEQPAAQEEYERRRKELWQLGIRPIWFPTGRFDLIGSLMLLAIEHTGKGARTVVKRVFVRPEDAVQLTNNKIAELSAYEPAKLTDAHYQDVIDAIKAGVVVPFLGFGANLQQRSQGEFVLARNLKFVKEVSRLVDIQPRIVYNRFRLHDGRTSNLEP